MALKIGTEDKKKVAVAAVLLIVVLFLVLRIVFQMFGSSVAPEPMPPTVAQAPAVSGSQPGSQPGPQQGPQQAGQPAGTEHEAAKVPNSILRLDPTLHPEWMAAAESLEYSGTGRNIFSMSSAPVVIEKPKGPIRPNPTQVAQGPPPPPPIDLKFFGYEAHAGGARKAFLLHGDDVFIAAAGDVVDHRYKILQIAPLSIQVEDLPYNNTQTLPLVQN